MPQNIRTGQGLLKGIELIVREFYEIVNEISLTTGMTFEQANEFVKINFRLHASGFEQHETTRHSFNKEETVEELDCKSARKEFVKIRKNFVYKLTEPCANCGGRSEQLHHIVPLAKGGTNNEANIIQLCAECHGIIHDSEALKQANSIKEAKRKLRERGELKEGRPRKFDIEKIKEALDYKESGHSFKQAAEKYGISKTTLVRRMEERNKVIKTSDTITTLEER